MKYYITYFYNLRFLKPNQLPISTAIWDPKWFHKPEEKVFVDSNGVINGLRCDWLAPGEKCANLCAGKSCAAKDGICSFLFTYRRQLDEIPFDEFLDRLNKLAFRVSGRFSLENPEIVLMVYEKPDNPCSERWPLIEWFKAHGLELEEWKA